jgi:hypothetical protein
MVTFKVVRARYRDRCTRTGAYYKTRLIDTDTASLEGNDLKDFFERASDINEICVLGEVRVEGDDHLLGDSYLED